MTTPLDKRALRKQMKARRKALKAEVAAQRAAMQAKMRDATADARRKKRLRRRLTLLAILILILLLLRNCECDTPVGGPPPPPPTGPAADMGVDAAVPDAAPPKRKKRPRRGRVKPVERPAFANPTPPKRSWIDALRLQVSARSPRMARCFEGVDQPGALKWTAAIDVPRGVTSDHGFDPVLKAAELTTAQRRCLTKVLQNPPYTLPADETDGQARVSMVIEF